MVEEHIWECNIWGIRILGLASWDLIGISQLPATLCDIRCVIPSASIITLLHHLPPPGIRCSPGWFSVSSSSLCTLKTPKFLSFLGGDGNIVSFFWTWELMGVGVII